MIAITYLQIFSTKNIIVYGPFLIAAITAIMFLNHTTLSRRSKRFWIGVFLVTACRGLVYRYIGGCDQAPVLPALVIWGFDVAYVTMIMLMLLSLVWWVKSYRHVVLPVLALMIAGVGYYNAMKFPEVREQIVWCKNLPLSLEGYRIVQLSDIHCCSILPAQRTRDIVKCVNALKPDFIAMTGDNVDGPIADRAVEFEPIFSLRAKDGIAWIRGNHEYFLDYFKWCDWYQEHGVNFLTNTCVFPRVNLAVAGVNDESVSRHARLNNYQPVLPDVHAAFKTATNGEFRILLQHRPHKVKKLIQSNKIDLMLCGHTHGGFCPIISEINAHRYDGFLRGLFKVGNGWLYVTPGLGHWPGLPVRFFDPSEISLIVLRRLK